MEISELSVLPFESKRISFCRATSTVTLSASNVNALVPLLMLPSTVPYIIPLIASTSNVLSSE